MDLSESNEKTAESWQRADESDGKPGLEEGESLQAILGYKPELQRNRSLFTLLFQSLAIAAIPYGEGSPLISAIYGGGQLAIFVGWIVILVLDECVALSLGELASRYPTSGGPSYWAFQLAPRYKVAVSYITGWVWLIGNITITLSVNFGFASLVSATISMYHPAFALSSWQLLLVFYAICLVTFVICTFGNRWLPMTDTVCAAWTAVSIVIILIALSVTADAGRHSASFSLGNYDKSFAGWGGFTFFIGLLPAAYTFSALGMISSMAEECTDPTVKVPRAISLCVPIGGIAGFFFIIPLCVTMPPLADVINAPSAQALPYIFHVVTGSPGGGLGLIFLVLVITLFCSISITVAASRCTWAFARDDAIPGAKLFAHVDSRLGVPVNALVLVTVVQMLLGLIDLGSTSAFTAFVSVGVQALALAYGIPIAISLFCKRSEVNRARWNLGHALGTVVNVVALAWIAFEQVLFVSLRSFKPATRMLIGATASNLCAEHADRASRHANLDGEHERRACRMAGRANGAQNYSSVVLVGFGAIATVWYIVHSRKSYKGPPASEGL